MLKFLQSGRFVCVLMFLCALPSVGAAQSASSFTAIFHGLGADLTGPLSPSPDGGPDYRITLVELRGTPSQITVTSDAGAIWQTPFNGQNWTIHIANQNASSADIYFSERASRNFRVLVRYPDGSSDQADSVSVLPASTLTTTFQSFGMGLASRTETAPVRVADNRITPGGENETPSPIRVASDPPGTFRPPVQERTPEVPCVEPEGSEREFSLFGNRQQQVPRICPPGGRALPPGRLPKFVRSTLTATFRGLGTDFLRPGALSPDGFADYRVTLGGLRGSMARIAVTSDSRATWQMPFNGVSWLIGVSNQNATSADIHFSEWPSSGFRVQVWYTDGSYDEADSIDAQVPSTLTATFRGLDTDVLSPGALSPDGLQDYRMTLGGLRDLPAQITVTSETNAVWRTPFNGENWTIRILNPKGSEADIHFSEWASSSFRVRVWYPDGSYDVADSVYRRGSSERDVVRFLSQATFGPTPALIEEVKQDGITTYIDRQLSARMQPYPDLPFWPTTRPATCIDTCQRDNYTYYQVQRHFFSNALTGEDQLRQRVAFALSQIMVTSGVEIPYPAWMRSYQQLLYRNAFGNFRQLLYDVTLHPTMGRYLNMQGSRCQRTNPVDLNICRNGLGSLPNENYAREVLQLFSVGTYLLQPDGKRVFDRNGAPIPTYDQRTVEEFARALTGWVFAPNLPGPPELPPETTVPNYRDPMVVRRDAQGREDYHDRGAKTLLNGITLPAGRTAEQDLNDAIDNIAYHPNVAPYISYQLIQRLVTSNPSPAYVRRISEVFVLTRNSSDQLFHVVRAILLDPEAREGHLDQTLGNDYGKLREPALFITGVLRALGGTSDGILNSLNVGGFQIGTADMNQNIFNAPSVFNYFSPGGAVPGENVGGPEFGIFSSLTSLRRDNLVSRLIFSTIPAAPPNRPLGTSIDLAPWDALAANPDALLDRLDTLLLAGQMSGEMRQILKNAVLAVPATNARLRVRTALYLVLTSSQYLVQR